MSGKVYIEIDAGSWLDSTGVETTVFLGDACDPCYTNKQSLEELIDRELEAHTVRGKIPDKELESAKQFVEYLIQASIYARYKLDELRDTSTED